MEPRLIQVVLNNSKPPPFNYLIFFLTNKCKRELTERIKTHFPLNTHRFSPTRPGTTTFPTTPCRAHLRFSLDDRAWNETRPERREIALKITSWPPIPTMLVNDRKHRGRGRRISHPKTCPGDGNHFNFQSLSWMNFSDEEKSIDTQMIRSLPNEEIVPHYI